ncbi:hypothetical protein T439DRAFT_353173 [Meredithblackwellia eburnea MCA 4105]
MGADSSPDAQDSLYSSDSASEGHDGYSSQEEPQVSTATALPFRRHFLRVPVQQPPSNQAWPLPGTDSPLTGLPANSSTPSLPTLSEARVISAMFGMGRGLENELGMRRANFMVPIMARLVGSIAERGPGVNARESAVLVQRWLDDCEGRWGEYFTTFLVTNRPLDSEKQFLMFALNETGQFKHLEGENDQAVSFLREYERRSRSNKKEDWTQHTVNLLWGKIGAHFPPQYAILDLPARDQGAQTISTELNTFQHRRPGSAGHPSTQRGMSTGHIFRPKTSRTLTGSVPGAGDSSSSWHKRFIPKLPALKFLGRTDKEPVLRELSRRQKKTYAGRAEALAEEWGSQ